MLSFAFLGSLDWRKKRVYAETVGPERNWNAAEQREWAADENGGFWKVHTFLFPTIHVVKGMLCCLLVSTGSWRIMLCMYDDRTCQIHEEKVKTSEDLLRRRELAVKTMEDTYDQRLKNELSRYFNRCPICTVSLWPTFLSLLNIFSLSLYPAECLSLEISPLCVQRMPLFYRFKSKISFLYNVHWESEKSHRFILQLNVLFQVTLKLSVSNWAS